jgi:hypothetical protein
MAERFRAVDIDDRHIVIELLLQRRIVVDIDKRDREWQLVQDYGRTYRGFRGIAEWAIVACVERHFMIHRVNSAAEDT